MNSTAWRLETNLAAPPPWLEISVVENGTRLRRPLGLPGPFALMDNDGNPENKRRHSNE